MQLVHTQKGKSITIYTTIIYVVDIIMRCYIKEYNNCAWYSMVFSFIAKAVLYFNMLN